MAIYPVKANPKPPSVSDISWIYFKTYTICGITTILYAIFYTITGTSRIFCSVIIIGSMGTSRISCTILST